MKSIIWDSPLLFMIFLHIWSELGEHVEFPCRKICAEIGQSKAQLLCVVQRPGKCLKSVFFRWRVCLRPNWNNLDRMKILEIYISEPLILVIVPVEQVTVVDSWNFNDNFVLDKAFLGIVSNLTNYWNSFVLIFSIFIFPIFAAKVNDVNGKDDSWS